ncbi:MAG: hypothetical protein Q8L15_18835 [Methylobacter sp.]|nr:hypothetical protein [Methylobacter sp.]
MFKSMRNLFVPTLIALAAFLSYNNNFFLVTADKLFVEHGLYSEQLVLDGILHGLDDNSNLRLGRYSRPEINDRYVLAHQLYVDKNKDGEFFYYKSQFGLQLYLFNFLSKFSHLDIGFLQSFSALMMSLIVALFFVAISREFSLSHAVFFCVPLILSPWIVIFAKNLYWVEATWFLPTVITFFFGKSSLSSVNGALRMGGMLFVAFLIKLLCGYEYLTTIALSACVPLVTYTVKYRVGVKRGLLQPIICGISLFLAFLIAVSLHARVLSTGSDTPFNDIVLIAKKRLATQHADSLEFALKEACKNEDNPEECQDLVKQSLISNPYLVTAKYFVMPHFIPWVDYATWNSSDKDAIKMLVNDKLTLESIQSAISRTSFQGALFLVCYTASILGFILFNIYVFRVAYKRMDSLSAGLLLSFLAPLSWFFLAKGHSYIHYTLNYVLWYLLYVPFGMLLIVDEIDFARSSFRFFPQLIPYISRFQEDKNRNYDRV